VKKEIKQFVKDWGFENDKSYGDPKSAKVFEKDLNALIKEAQHKSYLRGMDVATDIAASVKLGLPMPNYDFEDWYKQQKK